MKEAYIPVEGHPDLVRDNVSHAIINRNNGAYELAKKYDDVLFILNHTVEPCYQTKEYIESWEKNMKKIASCDNFDTKISGLGMFDEKWTTESTRIFVEKTIEFVQNSKEYVDKDVIIAKDNDSAQIAHDKAREEWNAKPENKNNQYP